MYRLNITELSQLEYFVYTIKKNMDTYCIESKDITSLEKCIQTGIIEENEFLRIMMKLSRASQIKTLQRYFDDNTLNRLENEKESEDKKRLEDHTIELRRNGFLAFLIELNDRMTSFVSMKMKITNENQIKQEV